LWIALSTTGAYRLMNRESGGISAVKPRELFAAV
jgi:hypothetical protein